MEMLTSSVIITESRLSVTNLEKWRMIPILHAVVKGMDLVIQLFLTFRAQKFDLILIQNPPCLPAVFVALIMCWFNGGNIILDWHNLGFKMFEERLGPKHSLVKLSKSCEGFLAKYVHGHVCVSRAMKRWLEDNFKITCSVLYDKPANIFNRTGTSQSQRHRLLLKLRLTDEELFSFLAHGEGSTIHTACVGEGDGDVTMRTDRAALIISSTSWTPDEDFDLLLEALLQLDTSLVAKHADERSQSEIEVPSPQTSKAHPCPSRAVVVITGKGPTKAAFEEKVQQWMHRGQLKYVAVRTLWLEPNGEQACAWEIM